MNHNSNFINSEMHVESKVHSGAPGWLSQLILWLLISAQVFISGWWVQAPHWAPCWSGSLLKTKQNKTKQNKTTTATKTKTLYIHTTRHYSRKILQLDAKIELNLIIVMIERNHPLKMPAKSNRMQSCHLQLCGWNWRVLC